MGFLSNDGRNRITSSKPEEKGIFFKIINFRIFNIGVTVKVTAFGDCLST